MLQHKLAAVESGCPGVRSALLAALTNAFLEVLRGWGWRGFSNGNRFEEAMERVRVRFRTASHYAF
ncbi:hypothetical protein [Sinorhizobium chiapasense]|uniref:Transposase n=1 Tax=Sinorhizobium chiapasense TaxID=501572 RepID=A0ABZ2BD12_9HYPH